MHADRRFPVLVFGSGSALGGEGGLGFFFLVVLLTLNCTKMPIGKEFALLRFSRQVMG
jgi:hypothetical protein